MNNKQTSEQQICDDLAQRMLAPYGCTQFHAVLDAVEPLFPIAHDERGGPFAIDCHGEERTDILTSFTDEGSHTLQIWALPEPGCAIAGIGVDLAATSDFDDRDASQRFIKLLFTDKEHALVRDLWPNTPALGYASVFAAREAAFKACARPLRSWYRTHEEELTFEAMSFSLVGPNTLMGNRRGGKAQVALGKMGIAHLEVGFAQRDEMALALVVATV